MTAYLPRGGLLAVLLLVSAIAATTAAAQPAGDNTKQLQPQPKETDITGFYLFQGQDGGKKYFGVVTVQKVRDTYAVHWMMPGTQYIGAGMRQGNLFTVGWSTDSKTGRIVGVHHLTIGKDGNLSGTWTSLPGAGRPQPETWEFLRRLPNPDKEVETTTPR